MMRGCWVTEGVEIFPAGMGRQMLTELLCGTSLSCPVPRHANKEIGECIYYVYGGRDGVVGIATRYGLDGPGFESRWRARFSGPIETGPEAHLASYTMGTGSFHGGRAAGAWR